MILRSLKIIGISFLIQFNSNAKISLESFLHSLNIYKPNAPWITQELMSLELSDFEKAFKEVVDIFTEPDKRWFYFCDNQVDFNQQDYWYQSLWQCKYYDYWLSSLYIDLKNSIFFDNSIFDKYIDYNKDEILPFSEYIKQNSVIAKSYYQFYAFFLDCITYFYCQLVYATYEIKDPQIYNYYLNILDKIVFKMDKILNKLKNSSFYNNYSFAVKRLIEILKFLEEEKRLQKCNSKY